MILELTRGADGIRFHMVPSESGFVHSSFNLPGCGVLKSGRATVGSLRAHGSTKIETGATCVPAPNAVSEASRKYLLT